MQYLALGAAGAAVGASFDLTAASVGAPFALSGLTETAASAAAALFAGVFGAEAGSHAAPLVDAAPYLFAGVSGAAAVACALAAAALWRRLERQSEELRLARARLSADLSTEKVFVVEPGRLMPASPATEAYLRATPQRRAGPDAAAADRDEPARGAMLREVFGAVTAERLTPRLRRLAEAGEGFDLIAPDADGAPWRFVGETVGARAVVRLRPEPRPPARSADGARDQTPPATAIPAAPGEGDGPTARAAALEHTPTGVLVFDGGDRLDFANAAARRLFRLDEDVVARRPSLRALIDHLRENGRLPERADYAAWRARALSAPIVALAEDAPWRLPGGDSLRVSAERLAAADGRLAVFVTDETDARDLDRRFRIAMGARRATIAAIDQGLAVVGAEGGVQLANPAFTRIWGLDPALAEEKRAGQFALADIAAATAGDARDRATWDRILSAIETGGPLERRVHAFAAERADGRRLALRVTPLPDGATLIACADVSDAHRVELALREKAEAVEAADRLKTEFLSEIAYQLRTPLNTVSGFTDMLRQGMVGPLDDRQREYLGYVLSAANDLRELIDDALELGALTSRGRTADLEVRHDLREIGASVMALLAKRAERRGARLELDIEGAPLPIRGDGAQLRQALFSAGTSTLSCAAPGDRIQVTIRGAAGAPSPAAGEGKGAGDDRGQTPLEARFEARLTRRHALGDAPRTAAEGLALSLARRIVRVHGGRGAFEETADGAAAILAFPLDTRGDAAAAELAAKPKAAPASPLPPPAREAAS